MSRLLLEVIIAVIALTPFEGLSTDAIAVSSTDIEAVDTCTGILSSVQLQDIQLKKTETLYAIMNGILVTQTVPVDLYTELSKILRSGVSTVSDVWLSHVPCSLCIDSLDDVFGLLTIKPNLHIESLRPNGSNYESLYDLGCLAKLRATAYPVKVWDWNVFNATYGHSCDYYSYAKNNTEYNKRKSYTEIFANYLEGDFTKDALIQLCVPPT